MGLASSRAGISQTRSKYSLSAYILQATLQMMPRRQGG
jgi:hypothetical protein